MKDTDLFKNEQQSARIRAEARFGLNEIQPFFQNDKQPQSVLEIGCGTGFLLSQLSEEFKDIEFTGVEPIGPGFEQFKVALDTFEKQYEKISFIRNRIEDITDTKKYDLIFSVNVFEHIDDWRQAMDVCINMLTPNGQLVILCPNYSVPYESHFALPIFGTKELTHKVFSNKITDMEDRLDVKGLWSSLNFIKATQIQKYCQLKKYNVEFDRAIMTRMFDRLNEDAEFKSRQSGLAKIAIFANRFGIGKIFKILPAKFSAYMKVVIST